MLPADAHEFVSANTYYVYFRLYCQTEAIAAHMSPKPLDDAS